LALGFMRRHRRWLFVFLWVVILAFIVLYIPAFMGADAGTPGETLARVGGQPITVGEFQKAYIRQRQMYERMYPGQLDAEAFRRMGLEEQTFDSLVTDRLIELEARRLGLTVDDSELARKIATSPGLQENGRFIGAREYRRRLELQGIPIQEFEDSARRSLLAEKLRNLVTDGVVVTPGEAEREFRRRNEQAKAEYVLVDAARFRPQVTVDDAEVRARFESARESYKLPERRVVSYLMLDAPTLQGRIAITEADLDAYYQDHKDDFKEEEQVCASHILVKVKSNDTGEGHPEAEAKAKGEDLLKKVLSGGDFAELAKQNSEDQGSAPSGGDLGCFGRGRMLPEFENAAFSLQPGQTTSELVKTSFGYHIIRVASRREEKVPALSEVKDRIRQILMNDRLRAMIEEQAAAISAELRRGRSLEQAGRPAGLQVKKSPPLARGEVVPPLASPGLVARVFELKRGETEPTPLLVGRAYAFVTLDEIQPPRVPELKEVQEKVKADLVEEKSFERARAMAADLRQRAETAGLDKAATALGLVRKETPGLVGRGQPIGDLGSDAALDQAVFSLPEKTLSEPLRAPTGYAVVRVLERRPFDAAALEAQKPALMAELRDARKEEMFRAYLNQARQRFAVERRPEAFRRVVG
jgi:peptidyl-prolyl cis-trans isomerase D